jgi:predicted PurR-regulated permease PerM
MSISATTEAATFRLIVAVLVALAVVTCVPLWAPVVMSAWVATMARPLLLRFSKALHGRERAAAVLTMFLVILMFVPIVGAALSLASGVIELASKVSQSKGGVPGALVAAVTGDESSVSLGDLMNAPAKILPLIQEHGAQALKIASGIAGAAAHTIIGLFIFFLGTYTFLVQGRDAYDWIEVHAPIPVHHTRRLRDAFHETGRGLFIGVGLTGLSQGVIATIAYLALGVPRALVLGMLTCIASLIPSVGTGLIWVPVAIGLALAGRTTPAIILALIGVFLISTIDNVMRPIFARYGKLALPTYALLISIFGGLTIFGPWGLVLGPLALRMAKEALILLRMEKLEARRAAADAVGADPSVVDAVDAVHGDRAFPGGADEE